LTDIIKLVSIVKKFTNQTMSKKIPETTIIRLSVYYRALRQMSEQGIESTSSERLADVVGYTAAQIRKDLAYFGQFGVPGRGYYVADLKLNISRILGINREWEVVIIGAGRLGEALIAYKGFERQHFRIVGVFDNNPDKFGKVRAGLTIHDIEELPKVVAEQRVEIGILTVPADQAQAVVNRMAEAGLKAILSFVPSPLEVPEGVILRRVDLAMELEALSYYLTLKTR
jgi:redox-sensing transcriptional repressor